MYLVDSHVLIWAAFGDERLSAAHEDVLSGAARQIVSVASLWALEIKRQSGKLSIPSDFVDRLCDSAFDLLQITEAHAIAAARLPLHHRDPFDRMLIAQAQAEGLTILTADRRFTAYDVAVI